MVHRLFSSRCMCLACNVLLHVWFHAVSLTLGSGPSTTINNNTEILITAIGEDGGLPSLTCHTDSTTCCRSMTDNNGNGRLGQWTFPDGRVILGNGASNTAGQQFYVNRIAAQVIGLNRREANNPLTPTGSYCCTVPTTGGEMTLCANLGEWIKLVYVSPSTVLLECFASIKHLRTLSE